MHWFVRFALWLAIAASILVFESWTAKSDAFMRGVGAIAFIVWLFVGALYVLRGIYRFVVSR